MPYLSTFFDSLTKEQYKLIQMGALIISKGKDHSLIVQGSTNANSKEKQIVKENKPKSDNEDERSNVNDEGSMNKAKKKGSSSKCSYCRKCFPSDNKCFNNNMDIMSQLLEKHNIDAPNELEKHVESSEHCHSA